MRRAQSLRSNKAARSSTTSLTDELGTVKESDESPEDVLRKQLLAAERENDKLKAQILSLQDQLTQRPPLEQIQELEREYKNLELLLLGTQRENERCMAELERGKNREKMLERELTKLCGENWQNTLNIPSSTAATTNVSRNGILRPSGLGVGVGIGLTDTSTLFLPQAESTSALDFAEARGSNGASDDANPSFLASPDASAMGAGSPSTPRANNSTNQNGNGASPENPQTLNAALAHIAQVRALILGMEERMQVRENKLNQEVSRAESETRRFEALRTEVDGVS